MSTTGLYRMQGAFNILLSLFSIILFFVYFTSAQYISYFESLSESVGADGAIVIVILLIVALCYGAFIIPVGAVLATLVTGIVLLPVADTRGGKATSILSTIAMSFLTITEFLCLFLTGNSFFRGLLVFSTLLCLSTMIFGIYAAAKKNAPPKPVVVYAPPVYAQQPIVYQQPTMPVSVAPTAPIFPTQPLAPTAAPAPAPQQPVSWFGEIPAKKDEAKPTLSEQNTEN